MPTEVNDTVAFRKKATFSGGVDITDGSLGDAALSAVSPAGVAKTRHQYIQRLSQVGGTAASAETRVVHVAKSAGNATGFKAGSIAAAVGDSTVTVDLRKNGTTVLSAVITLDNTNSAYTPEAGSINTAAYSAGDVFTVVIAVSAGTGTLPQGVYGVASFDELP